MAAPSILVVIQARIGSERFHGKVVADLCGKPLLQHAIDRARQVSGVADVIVAVPGESVRHRLETCGITGALIVPPQREIANEGDVLARFADVADRYKSHDVFMRLTADVPQLDIDSAQQVVRRFLEGNVDYVANKDDLTERGLEPTCEVFSRAALEDANREAATEFDREHVTPWIKQNLRTAEVLPARGVKPSKKSIDTPDELAALNARCR